MIVYHHIMLDKAGFLDGQPVIRYYPRIKREDFATVAQLVEQGPLKPKVPGSIPGRRTIQNPGCSSGFCFCIDTPAFSRNTDIRTLFFEGRISITTFQGDKWRNR